ncbi:MAG: nucleotidyl transferase AbiEii/AbiGii toxin family protein [Bacteroides sp.]
MSLWQNKTEEERTAMLQSVGFDKHLEELAVEKDWWVTATLKALFATSFADYLLFKGGTSLSKGWSEIDLKRFSEDIDIALSRSWFMREEVKQQYPFAAFSNNNQIKLLRKESRKVVFEQLSKELEEQLQAMGITGFKVVNVTTEETAQGTVEIDTDRDPVVINVEYASILEETNEYISQKIKVEISSLSMDEPFEDRFITSLIYDKFPAVDDGTACNIPTILPIRTFLEKAFLLNEEYQKKTPRTERMSRHLYDLEKLMDTYADDALADGKLYDEVIAHRQKFYHIGSVDYSKDQKDNIVIWPEEPLAKEYEKDYKAMTGSFIYDTAPLTFEELEKRIKELEEKFRSGE